MAEDIPFARVVALVSREGQLVTNDFEVEEDSEYLEVVISVGAENGVTLDMRFVIFENGPELFDPDTNLSLGKFEIVKGEGKVVHLQPRMSRLRTTRTRRQARNPFVVSVGTASKDTEYYIVAVPFKDPKIGDAARPI